MYRSRFLWKLYAGFVAIILLMAALVGVLVSRGVERDSLTEVESTLRSHTSLLRDLAAPALLTGEGPALGPRLRTLGRETGTRFTVIDVLGTVIADSEADPRAMDSHGNRPEILEARERGFGTSRRYSNTVQKQMMYAALSVRDGNRLIGFVRAALPLAVIAERLATIRNIVMMTAFATSAAALIAGFFFTRRVTRPLLSMTNAAQSIMNGNYDCEIDVTSRDEIGTLAKALNAMVAQLRSRMETIALDRSKVLAILSSMIEGVVAVDQDERVLHMNEIAGGILGADPEESIGRKIRDVTSVKAVCDTLLSTMRDDSEKAREAKLLSPAGKQKIAMQASPLRDSEGNLAGAVVVLHDVTELRRLEAVRRDFIANVSHELKTPVTAIRGLVETLIDDTEMEPSTQSNFLGRIREQSIRLTTLISDLLTLSRVEVGDTGGDVEPIDVRDAARASVKSLLPYCTDKRIALETDIPGTSAVVSGDREALRQVVDNLLDNAVKYTPEGGQVWLRIRNVGGFVTLEVEDTGIGIKPKYHRRIFERFYRVDKARSRELGGTGLGLSIVRNVVISMGGTVTVDSEPGQGSTFTVRIPSAPAREMAGHS